MSGRLLDFKKYVGGADNVQVLELFPEDQKKVTYSFSKDVSGYSFSCDWQSILLDSVTYDRTTGDPNFTETNVTGYFTNAAEFTDANVNIDVSQASTGFITLTIPEDRYTGNILPNARQNVVCTVLSFQWETDETPPSKDRHRWAILERFSAKVGRNPGNPALDPSFVSLTAT